LGRTSRLAKTKCPSCGTALGAATSYQSDAYPDDGDYTVCIECGHIMVFEGGRPRNPTDAEIHAVAGDPRIIQLQNLLHCYRQERSKKD
jgi:hypothetical protein